LDKIIPGWVNHVMHTAPVPFIIIDSLLICHKYPPRMEGIRSVFGYGILYIISIVIWFFVEGEWVYPILDVLDNSHRILFFIATAAFIILLYLLGDLFNSIIWGVAAHPPAVAEVKQGPKANTVPKKIVRKAE